MVSITNSLRQHMGTLLYQNAFYLMGRSGLNAVTGFVFWALAAKNYQSSDIGLAAAVISAAGLLASLSNCGLSFGMIRFLPGAGENKTRLINYCLTISGYVALLIALVFLAGLSLWSPSLIFVRQEPVFLGTFIVFVLISAIFPLLDTTFTASRKSKYSMLMTALSSVLKISFLLSFATFSGAFSIFSSIGLALVLAVIVGLLFLLPRLGYHYRPKLAIRVPESAGILRYSFGNYVADMFGSTPAMIYPLMVINMVGASENAYFYVGWMVSQLICSVPLAVSTSLFVEGSHSGHLFAQNARRSLLLSFLIIVPILLILFFFGREILSLFGKEYSAGAFQLLWILSLSAIPYAIVISYLTQKRVEKDIRSLNLISIALFVCQLGLSYPLLLHFGVVGIGVAVLATTSAAAIFVAVGWVRSNFWSKKTQEAH